MKTSARDLARYMIMHMNYGIDPASGVRIITEENSKLMQTPVIPTGDEGGYGLALTRTTNLIKGETMVGHTGSAYGLYSAMYFEPEKKFGIVMMTNGTTPDYATYVDGYAPVQRQVVNILYDVFIK
jgi:CubicO group peptidase (beta-lactamase class C family)